MPGVKSVNVDFVSKTATVVGDGSLLEGESLVQALAKTKNYRGTLFIPELTVWIKVDGMT